MSRESRAELEARIAAMTDKQLADPAKRKEYADKLRAKRLLR